MMKAATSSVPDLLGLPFDHYERYLLTANVIGLLGLEPPIDILDVGGHFGSLKHFRRDDRLVVADPQVPSGYVYRKDIPFAVDHYVRALGGALPFPDGSFDVVCAHDTLEHVPASDRPRFVENLLRTSRGFAVLNGPVRSPEAEAAEARIGEIWTGTLEQAEHSLTEHARMGLPEQAEVMAILSRTGLSVVAIPNGNVHLWLAMMALKSYLQGLPDAEAAHLELDRAFNASIAARDRWAPCYRVALVAGPQGSPGLDRVQRAVEADPPAPRADLSVVDDFARAMDGHLARMRGIIEELRADLERVNAEAGRRGGRIEELERRVRQREYPPQGRG
jgi:hypothetical protein